ncbi:MAG: HupE/UreJ family protein [Bryobacterales bacterium]|nr:HupE/UreJ family protein [Bryobacterales bacterium]
MQRASGTKNRRPAALAGLALLATASGAAHEIPSRLVVRMVAEARGNDFLVVARVPLSAIRDVEVPEFGPGYLDVATLEPQLPGLAEQWIAPFVELYEESSRVPVPAVAGTQVSLPSDRSLSSLDLALAHLAEPKPANSENLVWEQVYLDVLLRYSIRSDGSAFALKPGLGHLGEAVTTSLLVALPDGVERAYQIPGDRDRVQLDPGWLQAVGEFVRLGFWHILDGPDHLLFLVCLVLPVRRFRPLVLIVTAFTAAHSVTLVASAVGYGPSAAWFPPLVETLIAVSILFMAIQSAVETAHHRWLMALGFGLVHGFGFSFALSESLQFAGAHVVSSLLAFNIGVELGQLAVLCVLVPALAGLFRWAVAERPGMVVISAIAAHQAWHWSFERLEVLKRFPVPWGAVAAGSAAIVGGAIAFWGWSQHRRRRAQGPAAQGPIH